ncbi:MAG TPA: nucleotidyltransferase domain-containing protein [Candidatus Paceibacterota bacterium]|nr:nucleotidyltransferase domain-containing protein [Candidatus Paceibacterota bacterium]
MDKKNVPIEILELVSNYGKLIKKNGIHFDRIILFGSYAKNLFRKSSDIDVAVIIKDLKGGEEHKLQVDLGKLTWKFDTRIEPHPISLQSFLNNETPFVNEIKKFGLVV